MHGKTKTNTNTWKRRSKSIMSEMGDMDDMEGECRLEDLSHRHQTRN